LRLSGFPDETAPVDEIVSPEFPRPVTAKARANAERAEQTEVLFYFSGHARANALELGAEALPLAALRDRLRAIPSTLTIAVLDACQSGVFGAEPAADFSYNSVSHL